MKLIDLNEKIEEAKKEENSGNYFSAAIIYKEALLIAKKIQDSKSIKLCKAKIVEMNKKLINSGKDLIEHEFTYQLSKEQSKRLKNFIADILRINDKTKVLKIIGQHPLFIPDVKAIEIQAKKSIPISHQLATLTTISSVGHNLRGGSLFSYSWFMQIYDIAQQSIMTLYLNRLMYMLMHKNNYGNTMSVIDMSKYFSNSKLFNPSQLKIILVGISKYYSKDYISALHILVPQFESFLLDIAKKFNVNIVALDESVDLATRTITLSERHLESEDFIKIFGKDFCRQIKFVLFEPLGYKLRHKIAHGEISIDECSFQNVTLIFYLYLVLLARVKFIDR